MRYKTRRFMYDLLWHYLICTVWRNLMLKNMSAVLGLSRSYLYLCALNNNYSMLRLKLRYVTERQPNGFNDLQ